MEELRHLIGNLQHMSATGPQGFEGLVARLLERLTNQRFFLAHAGSQSGRDMSTGGFGGTGIAVEAKRFRNPKSFDQRELLGELVQAAGDEQLDLWVLASTAQVPDQIISALNKEAASRGIAIETLDAPPDRLGDLPVLCAAYEDVVASLLSKSGASGNLQQILEAIRRHPEFSQVLGGLRDRFSAGSIGYAQTRAVSLTYLRSVFEDSRRARARLGQPINVLENGGRHVVVRRQALEALDSWWNHWSVAPKFFVLLGEEGMGKTWALSSWLAHHLEATDLTLPLTLFLPSFAVSTLQPRDLIAEALATCTEVRDARLWSRRADAFVKRPPGAGPALLLVLDGLNEQYRFDWRSLLDALLDSPTRNQVATVLTCRPAYWRDEVAPGVQDSFRLFEVRPYDDSELASALEKGKLEASNLPSTLEPLLRHPRYLDLAICHQKVLEQSGDVTVDRLLYEDWKDRFSRKRGLFSDKKFRDLLIRLAEKHRKSFSRRKIEDFIPSSERLRAGLDEIITGGILVPDAIGRYVVEPRRLIQGLGLLLAEKVRSVSDQSEVAMREAMAALLEPHADTDKKVAICRSAATFALLEPDFPEAAQFVLTEQWIENRNLSREDHESFIAYLPAGISSYLRLVERFWAVRRPHHPPQMLLVQAFFRWRNNTRVEQALVSACKKWLSYVHVYGYRFMRGSDDAHRATLRQEIEERAGRSLRPGDKFLLVDELEAIEDDDLLWLSEPALLLASLFPAAPFIPALRRWALSRSVMGHPEEQALVAWVLRRSSEDLWPPVEAAVTPLLDGSRIAQQAAWRLLWACGREEAAPVLERLPRDLFPPTYYEETYAKDPCLPFWRREDCAMCAARPDLTDSLVAWKLAPHALDPDLQVGFNLRPRLQGALSAIRTDQLASGTEMTQEDHDLQEIEPALAAFTPDLLVGTYRALVRDLPNRGEDQDVLLSRLSTMALVLTSRERRVLRKAWEQICRDGAETWDDKTSDAEVDLFVALLFHSSAKTQLDLLLQRPEAAFDNVRLGSWFKRLPDKHVRSLVQSLPGSTTRDLQRKLWFLWHQPAATAIEALGAEWLVGLLNQAVPEKTQRIADIWLLRSAKAFDLAIERGEITPGWTRSMRRSWGGWLGTPAQSRLPYETLARAIDLGSLSYVVWKRPHDLDSYTRDLDRAVRATAAIRDDSLQVGFCKQTLHAITKRERTTVVEWVRLAVGQPDTRSSLIESSRMMFESLAEVLLEAEPTLGAELFKALASQRQRASTTEASTGVDVLALTLFQVPQSEPADALLHEWLNGCTTDKSLFELALASSACHNEERLEELVRKGLSSPVPEKKAAALILAGFAAHSLRSVAFLDSIELHPEGWLHEIRARAQRHLERDRWAQEWLRRFAASPTTEEAFAAYRLFLRCVDRRYWTWKDKVLKQARLRPDRRRFLVGNRDQIERAISKTEKEFEKRFLGHEIPQDRVYSWLRSSLG